jgi:hypothetical protein
LTDLTGADDWLERGDILTGNPKIHGALHRLLAAHLPG